MAARRRHARDASSAIATVVLIASSGTIHFAGAGARARRPRRRCSAGSCVTLALGALFLANQIREFFVARLPISSHAYGSIYYLMTGFHGLHVSAGLVLISSRSRSSIGPGRSTRRGPAVESVDVLLALRRRRVGRPVHDDLRDPVTRRHGLSRLLAGLRSLGGARRPWAARDRPHAAAPPGRRHDEPPARRARRELFLTGVLVVPRRRRRRHRPGPDLARRGRGRRRLPAHHRADARHRARPRSRCASRPRTTRDEIDALVAYVASLGDGPPIPDVDDPPGDLAEGGELFLLNCAACHSAAGNGGALSSGRDAPTLARRDAACRSPRRCAPGPGQMPVFGPETLTRPAGELDRPRTSRYLRDPEDPGGSSLGPGRARSPRAWSRSSSGSARWCSSAGGSSRERARVRGASR